MLFRSGTRTVPPPSLTRTGPSSLTRTGPPSLTRTGTPSLTRLARSPGERVSGGGGDITLWDNHKNTFFYTQTLPPLEFSPLQNPHLSSRASARDSLCCSVFPPSFSLFPQGYIPAPPGCPLARGGGGTPGPLPWRLPPARCPIRRAREGRWAGSRGEICFSPCPFKI